MSLSFAGTEIASEQGVLAWSADLDDMVGCRGGFWLDFEYLTSFSFAGATFPTWEGGSINAQHWALRFDDEEADVRWHGTLTMSRPKDDQIAIALTEGMVCTSEGVGEEFCQDYADGMLLMRGTEAEDESLEGVASTRYREAASGEPMCGAK